MIGVLLADYQRFIIWGVEQKEGMLTAELFYADVMMPACLDIKGRAGTITYRVEMPQELQGQIFPKKGQGIKLRILEDATF